MRLFIESANGQTELILTLSVSVFGGIAALLFQILIFNRKNAEQVIELKSLWTCVSAFTMLFFSMIFAYLVKGSLSALSFTLVGATIDMTKSITYQSHIPGLGGFRILNLIQALTFMFGMILVGVFAVTNYKAITSLHRFDKSNEKEK